MIWKQLFKKIPRESSELTLNLRAAHILMRNFFYFSPQIVFFNMQVVFWVHSVERIFYKIFYNYVHIFLWNNLVQCMKINLVHIILSKPVLGSQEFLQFSLLFYNQNYICFYTHFNRVNILLFLHVSQFFIVNYTFLHFTFFFRAL